MGARRLGTLAGAVALAALAVPAAQAAAKPGYFAFPEHHETSLTVGGTHGFAISISRADGWVTVYASGEKGAAIYLVRPQRTSRDGIKARLPGVGRVAVRFHPSGPPVRVKAPFFPECSGKGEIKQPGTYTGTIRFRGEHDFTRVAVARARGRVQHSFREVCKRSTAQNKPDSFEGHDLAALSSSRRGTTYFAATRVEFDGELDEEIHFVAHLAERRAGMRIFRVATATAGPETFVIPDPAARPAAASVAPPAPFSGAAEFRLATGGRAELAGTLAVDLPGAPHVPLAGPSFVAQLCVDRRCAGERLDR